MKVLLLADLNSAHTEKWACALAGKGYQVGIFTLNKPGVAWWEPFREITVFGPVTFEEKILSGSSFSKLRYLLAVKPLSKVIREFKPAIVHAHYATSYGLIGALSGFHPYVLSVWGSDVMDFPSRSLFHRLLLKYNFRKADLLLGTSKIIGACISRLTNKRVEIVPFGINTDIFKPGIERLAFSSDDVVVGTIKSMETIYGIDILLQAFQIVSTRHTEIPLKLLIVGGGTRKEEYIALAAKLGIDGKTVFSGKVPYARVPLYCQSMDVFVNLSRNESFGVSVLEAGASGKPVVVSAVGGLIEVVLPELTGITVAPDNIAQAAEAIERLVLDEKLRKNMGVAGRHFVKDNYDWEMCLATMDALYKSLIK
jgi:glycosyltransferase involved in cell wall biosynthesis